MKPYAELTKEELLGLKKELKAKYKEMQAMALKLDMSRGKPCTEQLDLSMGMMAVLNEDSELRSEDGTDCRNYGVLTGIPEALELQLRKAEVDDVVRSEICTMEDARYYSHRREMAAKRASGRFVGLVQVRRDTPF